VIQPNKIRAFLSYCFPVVLTLLFLPPHFFNSPDSGIDDSWKIALHLAFRNHLTFGKELIFTYGPLGILYSRLPIAIDPLVYGLFDCYFLVSLFFLFRRMFRERFHAGAVLFILLTAGFVMQSEGLEDWFFFLFLFYLFSFLREPLEWGYGIQAGLLAILNFYLRLNPGIIGVFAFLAVLTFPVFQKRMKPGLFLVSLFLFFLLFFTAGYFLHVDIGGYFRSGMQLVKDFPDAMLLPVKGDYRAILQLALVILAGLVLVVGARITELSRRRGLLQNMDELFIHAMICLTFFLYFKSNFVRADGRVFQFFRIAPILFGLLFIFTRKGRQRTVAGIGCWMVLALSIATASLDDPAARLYRHILTLSFLPEKVTGIGNYFHEATIYHQEAKRLEDATRIPNALRVMLGNHSVDIMPWDVSKIYFNGLNYAPRPVIQSYAAYNTYLDSLNAAQYLSSKAPDNILFTLQSIDQRFPFFDEDRTKLALIDRYQPAGYLDGELLLKKAPGIHRLIRDREEDTVVSLNEDIPIEKFDGLRFSRFFIDYGFKGRINRLLLVPPALKIVLTLENGDTRRYTAIKPILGDGIIVNKFVEDKEDFQLLMQGGGRLTPNIVKIRIETDSVNRSVRPSIRMRTICYRYRVRTTQERQGDSLGIQSLYNRLRPISLDTSLLTTGPVRYSLNAFTSSSPIIRVSGALLPGDAANTDAILTAVLRSGGRVFKLATKREGIYFSAAVARDFLPIGEYQLGLMRSLPRHTGATIAYSQLGMLIRSPYTVEDLGVSAPLAVNDTGFSWNIEVARGSGDSIHIGGWSFLHGVDPGEPTYIILKGNKNYRISTDRTRRADVAKSLNLSSDDCGFDVLLTGPAVARGQYAIGLERADRAGRRKAIRFPGVTIDIGFTKLFHPAPLRGAIHEDLFPSGIDHREDGKDTLFLSGWAVRKMPDVPMSTISIVLKGKDGLYVCPTNPGLRSDVTAYFKTQYNLDNCGFSATISKTGLPKGQYQIGLLVEGPHGDVAAKFLDLYTFKE